MGMIFYIVILFFGLILGGVVGMTSIGNGLIGTPGLMFFGVSKFEAVGTIGLAGVFMMMSSTYKHYKNNNVSMKTVTTFSLTAIPVSFLCANYKSELNDFISLRYIIGAVIILSVITLVYKFFISKSDYHNFDESNKNRVLSIVLGMVLGFFIGATSISGSLTVIAFMLCLKMPEKLAVGTTSFVAILALSAASIAHVMHGHVNWYVFAFFTPAVMVGGYFGAHYTEKIPKKALRIIIISLLLIAAICIFFKKPEEKTLPVSHGAGTEIHVTE